MLSELSFNILVINVDPIELGEIQTSLNDSKFNWITAESREAAISLASRHDCGLILIDRFMSDANLIETLADIRKTERYKSIPVLLLTQFIDDICADIHAIDGEPIGCVQKPFNASVIADKINWYADKVNKVTVSLPHFLRTLAESLKTKVLNKNIKLNLQLNSAIPVAIQSDPLKLKRILFNIVFHSVKHASAGEITLSVELENVDSEPPRLKFLIKEDCVDENEDSRLLFSSVNSTDNAKLYNDNGLGLTVARRLAKQLGGDVSLVNSLSDDFGCTFKVTVGTGDLREVPLTRHIESEGAIARAKDNKLLSGVKILIVDDVPENQFLLKHFLTSVGAQVINAENGLRGVEMALSNPVDLVIMDIQMPVLDGYQATRQLRQNQFEKPILALTAFALKEERERCLSAGCDDHLTKPVTRDALISYVSKYLR